MPHVGAFVAATLNTTGHNEQARTNKKGALSKNSNLAKWTGMIKLYKNTELTETFKTD